MSKSALTQAFRRGPDNTFPAPQSKKHITRATALGIACEVELGRLGTFSYSGCYVLSDGADGAALVYLQRAARPACG
jgi:hypothetical protein